MRGISVFVLGVVVTISTGRLFADEHPVPLEKNTDSAKCLECHEDRSKGPHVHTAVSMGCTTCHEVKVVKDTTSVELIAAKEELCFTCHEKSKETTLHGPYGKGNCVLCHDPHVSEFDNQLRASGNALCQECHLERKTSGKVTLFKTSHEFSETEFQEIPKIALDPTQTMGHPMGMHKVAEAPDPLHPGSKISCLTCHESHASAREKLVRSTELNGKKMDVCDACHLANDNTRMAEAQKRADALEAERQKEQQLQLKQPSVMPQKAPAPKGKQP